MILKEQILQVYNFKYACKKFDNTKAISKKDMEFVFETKRLFLSSFVKYYK